MGRKGILSKTEKILLLITLAFCCLMAGISLRDRQTAGAEPWTVTPQYAVEVETPELIPVNTASVEELMGLPGIGETLAKRIVADREANGPYQRVEDLERVNGIGAGKLAEIRDLIVLEESAP